METNRLFLRERTRKLIAELDNLSKEEQMEFWGIKHKGQLEEKQIRVRQGFANKNVDFRIFDLLEKDSRQIVGSCGFYNWHKQHERSEIAFNLSDGYRNKGYMSEAAKRIIEYGFNIMLLNRIEAFVGPQNQVSIHLLEKFGFMKEGILREHYKETDTIEDSLLYSLLRSDFIANN